jgi:ATP-dependent Clp protease ATP-binding subunit ClpX
MNDMSSLPQQQLLEARRFFRQLPMPSPRQIDAELQDLGYRGQEAPRRALCLMAYRHLRRIRRLHLEGVSVQSVPPKSNYLLVGPTGCGKTYAVELLFGRILKIPTVVVDTTSFSETGYVGDDPVTILTRLLRKADLNPLVASVGIVCLDELDKLATTQNSARFDGQGTTKDVSGFGVQKELLKMLESSEVLVPLDGNNTMYSSRVTLSTRDIAFIACGAFSGLKLTALLAGKDKRMGYVSAPTGRAREAVAARFEQAEVEDVENFRAYGFLPELIGRFARIVPFLPLDDETLRAILVDNVLARYVEEFRLEGLELDVEGAVVDRIVALAHKRQTGARGLDSVLIHRLEEVAFDAFAAEHLAEGRVRLHMHGDEIRAQAE